MHPDLAPLVADAGVVARASHPHLRHAMDAALRRGDLARVLPGIYARTPVARHLLVRARAVHLAEPDAVVTGQAAAHLLGWAVPYPSAMVVATGRQPTPAWGIRWERRRLERTPSRLLDGYRIASKALIALDLSDSVEDALELAARHGVTPDALLATLAASGRRPGNAQRRRRVQASRDHPWSPLERSAHGQLRRGGVRGWRANVAIRDRHGELLGYGDVVFAGLHLVLEIDGREHHSSLADRVADGARDLALARAGWEVVRIPAALVRSPRLFLATVRDVLATRRARR